MVDSFCCTMESVRPICAILALQFSVSLGQSVTQSSSQSSPSYGSVVADDFNKNLVAVEKNLYKGVVSVTDPAFKFAIDTAPDLAHLYAIFNGVSVPTGLASLGKDLYGKTAVGGGKLFGKAAVLGSSILGNGFGTLGQFLEQSNGILENRTRSDINFTKDNPASKGARVVGGALTALGDGLISTGSTANVISDAISQVINEIAARLVLAIQSAHKLATALFDTRDNLLKNGVLTAFDSKTQESVSSELSSYVKILSDIQNLISSFMKSIIGLPSNSSVNPTSGATTSNSTTFS